MCYYRRDGEEKEGEGKVTAAFHAITGCDTRSQFVGIGKQKRGKPSFEGRLAKLLEHLGEEIMLKYLQMLRHLCASFTIIINGT